ncbi:DHH family phosphoesterase [Parvicella tangerina]|uniref:Bifunctional oligoribonuclease and PAP phosphatase NrnA n=1 Tax=Parvicella tangerina TaxID=2829795 RepID=A0A916JM36_9FLAO|nr:DHH family phosphoesterase [Parvicella tangerina]CAG5080833.1 Bifunctional oligoribonuclease and PAP phosphatase NrnA [Parvicella tangerina]
MKNTFEEVERKLVNASSVVITSHQSPDGDAVGSSLALYHYLLKKGIKVAVILPDKFPPFLKWMGGTEQIKTFDEDPASCNHLIDQADVLFILDYNDPKRVGEDMGRSITNSSAYKVMIDHHLNPTDMANWMMSDTNSCSTAQLIYEFVCGLRDEEKMDSQIGEGIYTGLVTDSGSFRFPSVDARTHEIAAALIRKGLNHSRIHESLFDVNSLNRLKLLGYSLSEKLKVLPNIPVAVIYLSKKELDELDNQKGSTEGLVNYALSVEGIQMAAFIKEDVNKVKLSFRSKGDVAVNEFSAKHFSGGGHKNAAGGVSFDSFDETIKKFENVIYEFWK